VVVYKVCHSDVILYMTLEKRFCYVYMIDDPGFLNTRKVKTEK
jgi:hypothetical protein